MTIHNRTNQQATARAWQRRFPERVKAHRAVRVALRSGRPRKASIVLVIMLLLSVSSVHAETRPFDIKPVLVLVAGQAADLGTTLRFLHTGRCTEGNALYGPQPSSAKLIVSSLAITGSLAVVSVLSQRSENKTLRTLGKVFGYAGGGVGFAAAGWNLKTCGV